MTGGTSGTATVLFTDLVGSTEFMSRLGDLTYDELRAKHFARLRESVLTHQGDEVKHTAWLARTRLEWAQMLQRRNRRGDAGHAAELLMQALDTAVDLGLGAVERRARALLTLVGSP